MINFNHFRIFYYAAKAESFTDAAEKLFITQPAVTAQIHAFEEACNLKLFKKKGRHVQLTDEGKALFHYARKVFEFEHEIEVAIDKMHQLKRGVLRIGTTKTYARYFMPYLLSGFLKDYPDIKVFLNEGSSAEMTRGLLDLTIEIAVIAKAEENPAVVFRPFSQEELLPILPPVHRLAGRDSVHFTELAGDPIILKDSGSGTRRRVADLFARYGRVPNILMETNNVEFIKELVGRGEGFSFLVKAAVVQEVKEKRLVTPQIRGEHLYLDVSIAYLKDQSLSRPAKAFLRMLENLAGDNPSPAEGIGALTARILARAEEAARIE